MTFLITGASGQLAREFQRRFERDDVGYNAPAEAELDITDAAVVQEALSSYRPDVVLNCAAYNDVEKAESDWATAYAVNAEAVRNLADACAMYDAQLVHYGTDYVFDGKKEGFYTEEDTPNPLNNYGKSKLAGEHAVVDRGSLIVDRKSGHVQSTTHYSQPTTHDPQSTERPALVLRVSWVYGPGQQNFFYKLQQWSQKNDVLKVVWDQLSLPTYTADIVTYTLKALDTGLRGTYHLTNTGYASRYEIARHFLALNRIDKLVLPVDSGYFGSAVERPFFSAMSNVRLSAALDTDIPAWQDALERFVRSTSHH